MKFGREQKMIFELTLDQRMQSRRMQCQPLDNDDPDLEDLNPFRLFLIGSASCVQNSNFINSNGSRFLEVKLFEYMIQVVVVSGAD